MKTIVDLWEPINILEEFNLDPMEQIRVLLQYKQNWLDPFRRTKHIRRPNNLLIIDLLEQPFKSLPDEYNPQVKINHGLVPIMKKKRKKERRAEKIVKGNLSMC
jgi:hypothetical protein